MGLDAEPRKKSNLHVLPSERAQFAFGSRDRESLIRKLGPVVRTYAKNGVRKPKDVCKQLNDEGLLTACGQRWTPRLATLLLAMIFEKPTSGQKGVWERSPAYPQRMIVRPIRSPMLPRTYLEFVFSVRRGNVEDITGADRLSACLCERGPGQAAP